MGEAAARGADLVVVTSDNPRTEEPGAIIGEIVPGVGRGRAAAALARQALAAASGASWSSRTGAPPSRSRVAAARPGDVVLIAGKGHEDYQIVGRGEAPLRRPRGGPQGPRRRMSRGPRFTAERARRGHRRRAGSGARAGERRGRLHRHPHPRGRAALFVALRGERFDGHDFLAEAAARGAAAAVVAEGRAASRARRPRRSSPVDDTLAALGAIARLHRRRFAIPVVARHRLERQDHHPGDDRRHPRAPAGRCSRPRATSTTRWACRSRSCGLGAGAPRRGRSRWG